MNTSFEAARGCGFRKVGGLYLVFDGPGEDCGKMPIPLWVCPTCGAGIKAARGWTWIDGDALAAEAREKACPRKRKIGQKKSGDCGGCPMDQDAPFGRAVLIWIGESFYATPADFQREAKAKGISRRIAAVPRGFEIGKTFVFLAHRESVAGIDEDGKAAFFPGVFSIFRPTRIEIVCDGTESPEQIAEYEGRGLTPVRVVPIGVDNPLFPSSESDDENSN